MSKKNYQENETKSFDDIKHIDEYGNEYWEARELQLVLEYTQWRNFTKVIDKAKLACINSNNNVSDHFADVSKMVQTGDSKREILEWKFNNIFKSL